MMKTLLKLSGLALGLMIACETNVYAQQTGVEALAKHLDIFKAHNLQEKLYVHTDRETYLAGEIAWFKIYNVEGTTNSPIDMSKVAYVEVLDKENNPVLQTKVGMGDGQNSGSLFLPATLSSGNYVLRAYTSWMKNFSSDFYFEKPLTIVNTFKKLGLEPQDISVTYNVQFFPEGGHMVNGLESKVAFRAVDKHGKGIKFEGIVLNQRNDTVAHLHTRKFGIGYFFMTPAQGDAYRAVLRGPEGQIVTRNLPIAQERGMVMQLTEAGPDEIQVKVNTRPIESALGTQAVYLLAHTRHEAKVAEMQLLDQQGEAIFRISKNKLGDGISHLTVFNAARQPLVERLYFKRPQNGLQINAGTTGQQFAFRSPVTVGLSTRDLFGKAEAADLSIAVYKQDSLQRTVNSDIQSYLWLTSDLKGTVESPAYYFTERGAEADIALDNLMLTHGWRRFRWEGVLKQQPTALPFIPEYGGHLMKAKVTNSQTGRPAQGVVTYLSSPSRMVRIYNSRSAKNGEVMFDVRNFNGARDILLQAEARGDTTYKVELENPFSSAQSTYKVPAFDLSEKLGQSLFASSIHLQVQNHHVPPSAYNIKPVSTDSSAFFGKPDRVFKLDDYTRFPVMEEVMREYVQPVMVRKRQGSYQFFVLDLPRNSFMVDAPLVLLDGVPVLNIDKIMALDPRKVERLEVVSRKYFHGLKEYSGIVSYVTYKGDMGGMELDAKALLMAYEGVQEKREFYSPRYDNEQQAGSRVPDLRNLLYWAPTVVTDKQGTKQLQFYTSDQEGIFVVEVQGITKDGKAGSARYTFEVKKNVL